MVGKRVDVFGEGYRGKESRRGKYLCIGFKAPAIGNGGSVDGNAIEWKDYIIMKSNVTVYSGTGPLHRGVRTKAVSV